ncbi:MAG: SIMPL domain-containing protein [Candidatus Nanopelagicaceae bacterium]
MDEMIEKRKGAIILIASVIVSLALGVGLTRVGSGFASRSSDGIVVTGSAKVAAKADNVVWTLSVQNNGKTPATAVSGIDSGINTLQKYLVDGGIPAASLTLGPVNSYPTEEYINGNPTGRILNYRANREITVRTKDVQLVSKLSQNIGSVLQQGVNLSNYGPQYYISTLNEIRPKLMKQATQDAKKRALAMADAVGDKVGALSSVKAGPIQVTTPDSTMTSDYGMYDTSTIDKTVTATVTVTFKTK